MSPLAVLEPGEVLEVGAVGDRHDAAPRVAGAHLVCDRVGDRDDRVRLASDQRGDGLDAVLLHPHGEPLRIAVGVRDHGVAQVGDPACARARLTAAPTKWMDGGGEVVMTTSIPSSRTMRTAAGMAVRL